MVLAGASKSVVTTVGVYVAIALTAFLTYVTLSRRTAGGAKNSARRACEF